MPEMKRTPSNEEEIKERIIQAAADLYANDRMNFNIKNIARQAGVEIGDIYSRFDHKYAILESFYSTIVPRYRTMIEDIPEYKNFTAGEKIANFIYTSFDILGEHQPFVKVTFNRIILIPWDRTRYHHQVEQLFHDILDDDTAIPASIRLLFNAAFVKLLTIAYFRIIRLWIYDKSVDSEKTLEFVDKLTSFLNEIFYNTTLEKGFDLMRFIYDNKLFVPDLSNLEDIWCPSCFKRS